MKWACAYGAYQLEYFLYDRATMSEVPESDEGPNPFSFKNFVKRTSTTEQAPTSSRGQRSARSGSGRRGEDKKDPAIHIKKKKKKPGGGGGESKELPFPDIGATADAGIYKVAHAPYMYMLNHRHL